MKFRKLRIAWSVGWALLAVPMAVLWVRSYWWQDSARGLATKHVRVVVISDHGWLVTDAEWNSDAFQESRPASVIRSHRIREQQTALYDYWFYNFYRGSRDISVQCIVPTWFPAALLSLIAVFPWLRFSLRTLLIATTIVGVVLGIKVWMSRGG